MCFSNIRDIIPLELRKQKDEKIEIAALFHHIYGKGKSAAISKLESFLTEWSRSFNVFALKDGKYSSI